MVQKALFFAFTKTFFISCDYLVIKIVILRPCGFKNLSIGFSSYFKKDNFFALHIFSYKIDYYSTSKVYIVSYFHLYNKDYTLYIFFWDFLSGLF